MRFSRLLFFLTFALSTLSLSAQDTHFTLHNYAPLWLNPANTGSFSGTVRVGGVYRGQWHSLSGIQTPTAYADATLPFAFRKQDWIGVGLNLVNDQAGDFDISSNFFGFSGAYHLSLDKRRTNIFTIGVQYGSTSYGITMPESMVFNDLIQGRIIDQIERGEGFTDLEIIGMMENQGPGGNNNSNNNQNYNDLNAGVKLKLLLDKKKGNTFEGGVSLFHLNRGERASQVERDSSMFLEDGITPITPGPTESQDTRRRRSTLHAHARLDLEMSEKWRFQPTVFLQTTNSTSSISLQAWGSRKLKNDLAMRMGLGYRTGDAAKVMFGFDTDQLRGALAYDITLSQARNANSYQGAFELGIAYIFNIYKKPVVDPTILCPRL